MKNNRVLLTILFPFSMLLVLYMYQSALIKARTTYIFSNILLYDTIIGAILAISLFLVTTVKLESIQKLLIFLGCTFIWIIFDVFIWTQFTKMNSILLLALANSYHVPLTITFAYVIKSAISFYEYYKIKNIKTFI